MAPTVQAASYQEQFSANDINGVEYAGTFTWNAQITRQWANTKGGTSYEKYTLSPSNPYYYPNSYIMNLLWPVFWPDGQTLIGTMNWTTTGFHEIEGCATSAPSAWGNSDLAASGAAPIDPNKIYPQTASRQLTRRASTEVQLAAGGPAVSGSFQLVRLLLTAAGYSDNGLSQVVGNYNVYYASGYEIPGNVPIPAANIQLLGSTVATTATNSNVGEAYVVLPAGGTQNLPISVIGTNSNNYSFDVQATPGLTIVDANSGQDLTTQTNTVMVGQQMNLICKTVTTNGPVLSNFQWQVPGYAISNYVVAADTNSSTAYINYLINNTNVVFYWVDGASNCVVQCSASINGQTVVRQAVFNVLKPSADLLAFPGPGVTVDDNYYYLSGTVLHFGTLAEIITETN